jgi:hypothetical protein
MKRALISLCVGALLPVLAQAQTTNAKPAKKPAATAATATEGGKPKSRLLTKDQLRKCLKLNEENGIEDTAIGAEKVKFDAEREKIVIEKAALLKQSEELQATSKSILDEQKAMMEEAKEFEKPVPRSERTAAEEKRKDFNARAANNSKRTDEYNATKSIYNKAKEELDPRIDANNAFSKTLQSRAEEHGYALESWQAECADRPYMDADEIAIKKEWAKEKAK